MLKDLGCKRHIGLKSRCESISQSRERKLIIRDNHSGDLGKIISHGWKIVINRRLIKWVFEVEILDHHLPYKESGYTRIFIFVLPLMDLILRAKPHKQPCLPRSIYYYYYLIHLKFALINFKHASYSFPIIIYKTIE